jgi:SAM-dependent methyltransferase
MSEMREFWDARARENALWYIHSQLDYNEPDSAEFWRSGEDNLDRTLGPFGIALRGDERVLEIGCGMGRITRALAGRAASVVGVDVSPEMVERGSAALRDVPNLSLEVGNGTDLAGFDSNSFDACYSFIVFQHIPDPAITCGYIREIGRILRPGGWTVFQVSDRPEIHRRSYWRLRIPLRERLRRLRGRAPRGCMDAPWLGSAVPRADLLAALADGGMRLESTVGDGTQFCLVFARKEQA